LEFINIHTHNKNCNNTCIINLFPNEVAFFEDNNFFSIGIHPWDVAIIDIEKQIRIVKEYSHKKNILAIGEIGLDKYREDFELQKEMFLKQIDIANHVEKPIIVHCVKAYSDLLEILKNKNLKIPIIIHRYSGNKTIAKELLKFGCFLSFGHELFNSKSKLQKVFKQQPLENIFLETDDSKISIENIYKKASEIKEIDIESLHEAILFNFVNVFRISNK
jgi:TatD DNase family protein